MPKIIQSIAVVSALASFAIAPLQAAPSPDMVGKSYTVTWTEGRQGRVDGSEIRSTSVSFQLQIYVGATGRPFTRLTQTSRSGSASNEQVGGSGQSLGGGARSVRADGNTIMLQANFGNFARNGRIDVSGGGCSAQMSVAKEAGSSARPFRNANGQMIEIHSVSVSGTSCSVQQGNVFGR